MIIGGADRVNSVKFVKLKSGKIVRHVDEQYLRKDIPCGVSTCPLCDKNQQCNLQIEFVQHADVEMVEDEQVMRNRERIYIVDHLFTLNQYDFIENCEALSNFVLPDTVLRYLNRKNIPPFIF